MITLTKLLKTDVKGKLNIVKALTRFNGHLFKFVECFDSLHNAGIGEINVENTILRKKSKDKEEMEFLGRAITAHLRTHGYSVVIGDDINLVNKVNFQFEKLIYIQ